MTRQEKKDKRRDRDTDTDTDAEKLGAEGVWGTLPCLQAGRQGGVEDMRVVQVGEDILSDTQITAR